MEIIKNSETSIDFLKIKDIHRKMFLLIYQIHITYYYSCFASLTNREKTVNEIAELLLNLLLENFLLGSN